MAARRRKSRRLGSVVLGAHKVCKVKKGRVVCKSAKSLSGMRRRKSRAMGAMPRRNAKGRFVKSR